MISQEYSHHVRRAKMPNCRPIRPSPNHCMNTVRWDARFSRSDLSWSGTNNVVSNSSNQWLSARLAITIANALELLQSCTKPSRLSKIVPLLWKFMHKSPTSGIPAGLVRWMTAYFLFSHKLQWPYIFQTSEWYIPTSDFYNPLARLRSAFNLKACNGNYTCICDS